MDKLVEKAREFIAGAGGNVLTVPEVTEALGVNRRALERRFKAEGGDSLLEEITKARLGKVAALLAGTNKTIFEIAMDCSFSSSSYLVSVFKKHYGMTTREFRRRHAGPAFAETAKSAPEGEE